MKGGGGGVLNVWKLFARISLGEKMASSHHLSKSQEQGYILAFFRPSRNLGTSVPRIHQHDQLRILGVKVHTSGDYQSWKTLWWAFRRSETAADNMVNSNMPASLIYHFRCQGVFLDNTLLYLFMASWPWFWGMYSYLDCICSDSSSH